VAGGGGDAAAAAAAAEVKVEEAKRALSRGVRRGDPARSVGLSPKSPFLSTPVEEEEEEGGGEIFRGSTREFTSS